MPRSCVSSVFPFLPPRPIDSKHCSALFQQSLGTDASYESLAAGQQQQLQKLVKKGERCSAGLVRGQGAEQQASWQGLDDRVVTSLSYVPDCPCCWTSGVTLLKP